MDEASLWGNLAGKPIFDFSEPLTGDQLAPLGFLIAQRALMSVLGVSRYAARLLAARVRDRLALPVRTSGPPAIWPRRPALIALVLFAFSDDLIYYSSELKPYSLDLAIGLAVTLGWRSMPWESRFRRAPSGGAGGARHRGPVVLVSRPPSSSRAAARRLIVDCLIAARAAQCRGLDASSGSRWLASFFVSYRCLNRAAEPVHDDVSLLVFRLPAGLAAADRPDPARGHRGDSARDLRHPVEPGRPDLALGGRHAARSRYCCWVRGRWRGGRGAAWAILVLPIILAMVASAMQAISRFTDA